MFRLLIFIRNCLMSEDRLIASILAEREKRRERYLSSCRLHR